MPPTPEFVDAKDAGALIGVSAATITRAARMGRLKRYKVQGTPAARYRVPEVLALLKPEGVKTRPADVTAPLVMRGGLQGSFLDGLPE